LGSAEPDALVLAALRVYQQCEQGHREDQADKEGDAQNRADTVSADIDDEREKSNAGDEDADPVSPALFVGDAESGSGLTGHDRQPEKIEQPATKDAENRGDVEQHDGDLKSLRLGRVCPAAGFHG